MKGSAAHHNNAGRSYFGSLIPSPMLVVLAVIPFCLAVATWADPSLLNVMLIVDALLVGCALFDALLAWRPRVTVHRDCAAVFSLGRKNPVTLRVRSTARRNLKVTIAQDVFAGGVAADLPATTTLGPSGRNRVTYHVLARQRGEHHLGDHYLRYASPLGLWIRQLRLAARCGVKVYPDVQLVRTYERLAGQNRGSSMLQSRPRRGGESEFEQLRDYVSGDSFRSVDWKATARRGKLISREYQVERDQHLLLALDTGRLMTAEAHGISLFDHALNATLMVSHIASRGGDQVGLLTFDSEIRSFVAPISGGRAMQQIMRSSYAIHPRLVATDFERGLSWISTRIRKRTLVVLFTHISDHTAADELVRMTKRLSPRHLPVVVLFRDLEVDALAACIGSTPLDDYTAGAAAELLTWRDGVLQRLRAAGMIVIDVRPGDLTTRLVNTYLDIKARHLL